MLQAMDAAWRKTEGLKKLTHEAGDLYRRPLLPDELDQFDAAVIDPHARALRHKFMNWREVGLGRYPMSLATQ